MHGKIIRPALRSVFINWLPVVICMVLIAFFSSQPRLPQPISAPTVKGEAIRQTIHMIEYAVLTTLLWRALTSGDRRERKAEIPGKAHRPARGLTILGMALAVALIYALLDEWHQRFIPNRDSSLADVAADTAGAAIALLFLICLWALRVRNR